jgi:hypothetical protein
MIFCFNNMRFRPDVSVYIIAEINLVIHRHNYFCAKSNPRVNRIVFASGLFLPEADMR